MKVRELWPSFWRARALRARVPAAASEPLPVVVSLTSIPSRLAYVDLPIRSVLAQSRPPERVVLWLHESLRDQLPRQLTELKGDRFEISYVDGTSSHRKLVPSLRAFPERVIVTCDDDVMYDEDWLSRLWADHERFPTSVIAHEGRAIGYSADGTLLPYAKWRWEDRAGVAYDAFVPVGYGGTLYPPLALLPDVSNESLYLTLTPTADDLWFKMMSLQAGTMSRRTTQPVPKPVPVIGAKGSALAQANIVEDRNRVQWEMLCAQYGVGPLSTSI